MKRLGRLRWPPVLWQDFTFADDVMKGKTGQERHAIADKTKKRIMRKLKRMGFMFYAIWRLEWEPRKSGPLLGQLIPHYHVFFLVIGLHRSELLRHAWLQATLWVNATGTAMRNEALSVAMNPKSYRLIDSRKEAYCYASKRYVSKAKEGELPDVAGRAWGVIGECPQEEPEIIPMTYFESVSFRRCCRKHLRKPNRNMKIRTRSHGLPYFIFLNGTFVHRYLEGMRFLEVNEYFTEVSRKER